MSIQNIAARLAHKVTASPAWQAQIIKSLSVVRRPKIVEQTEDRLTVLVGEFSLMPSLSKLMLTHRLAMDVSREGSAMVKVTVRTLQEF